MNVKYPNVHVKLTGTDGNVFSIIGKVSSAIRKAVGNQEAKAFVAEATSQRSYDAVLVLVMETVDVQ